jgi:hypothetical protein
LLSLRSSILAGAALSLCALVGGACSSANNTHQVIRDARISGNVEMCKPNFGKCAPLATTVEILSVHGATLGSAVAKQYARHGQFTFLLAPGKYFVFVKSGSVGVRCISGEVSVRAGENQRDNVTCYTRMHRHSRRTAP